MLHTEENQGCDLQVDMMSTIFAAILQAIDKTGKIDDECPSDITDPKLFPSLTLHE